MTQTEGPYPPSREDEDPDTVEDLPAEEGFDDSMLDTDEVDKAPEEQLSRPEQPDFDPAEAEPFRRPSG